jgi:hypothetical protein
MDAYVMEVAGRAAEPREADEVEGSLSLLRAGLEGYGYQYLTATERPRWHPDDGEDGRTFCELFGARVLAKYIDEFLGYFMIRKVGCHADQVAEIIEDVRGFVAWLAETGELPPVAARKALGRLARGSDEVPAAERLSELLYGIATRNKDSYRPGSEPACDEIVEEFLVVDRVAPGRIWFLDGVGPIKVSEAASRLARPGWTINLVLGRRGDRWDVLEVGNVYPETLA